MKNIIFLIALMILSACTCKHETKITLPNTEVQVINSKENDVAYKLFVSLPEGYDMEENHSYRKNYPVLYLLDPDIEFAMLESIAQTMVNYDTIEPFIIVGIGYQNQDLAAMNAKEFWNQWTKNRARDYIPIKVQQGKEDFEGGDHEYSELSNLTGGSAKFKNFIEKELVPYINQTYRVSNERALVCHSQAGLISSWMMLENPGIFEKYIILSPSLWVEKGQMLKQSNRIKSSDKIIAYFAVGSQEHDEKGSMVNDLKTFYNSLHKPEGSNLKLEIIDDENHVSMVPIALTRGLKYLFGK
ncbi:MAG: alpha/beta hydrolase [Rickettsiaceae bacterium]|nr:alpha/beta hydrolase [Rickettsiaceae bacterium]